MDVRPVEGLRELGRVKIPRRHLRRHVRRISDRDGARRRCRRALRGRDARGLGHAARGARRHPCDARLERRVVLEPDVDVAQPERLEHLFAQQRARVAPAGAQDQLVHHVAEVHGVVAVPSTRRPPQRDLLHGARDRGAVVPVPRGEPRRPERKAAAVTHHVPDRDGLLLRQLRGELGPVRRHRLVEVEGATLVESPHGDCGQPLRRAEDDEHGVRAHRLGRARACDAAADIQHPAPAAVDRELCAVEELARRDRVAHLRGHVVEHDGVHADGLWVDVGVQPPHLHRLSSRLRGACARLRVRGVVSASAAVSFIRATSR